MDHSLIHSPTGEQETRVSVTFLFNHKVLSQCLIYRLFLPVRDCYLLQSDISPIHTIVRALEGTNDLQVGNSVLLSVFIHPNYCCLWRFKTLSVLGVRMYHLRACMKLFISHGFFVCTAKESQTICELECWFRQERSLCHSRDVIHGEHVCRHDLKRSGHLVPPHLPRQSQLLQQVKKKMDENRRNA